MTEQKIKELLDKENIHFVGIQLNEDNQPCLVLFDNLNQSTLAVKYNEFSIENVKIKILKSTEVKNEKSIQ